MWPALMTRGPHAGGGRRAEGDRAGRVGVAVGLMFEHHTHIQTCSHTLTPTHTNTLNTYAHPQNTHTYADTHNTHT